jgi:hypothetical protein
VKGQRVIHIVTYDLTTPNDTADDYSRVISAIKSEFSSWAHIEKSVWLIDTTMNPSEVRDRLKAFLHEKDVLFVAQLKGAWASWYFGKERNEWLKNRTF